MTANFDQPIILRRSPILSRALLWTIVGFTGFTIIWASLAKIDEAVSAPGKLEPQGAVKNIQVPLNGVVKAVYIKDGQRVKKGDLLLTLDQAAAEAQRNSLTKIRAALVAENRFYRGETGNPAVPQEANLAPSPEVAALTRSRATLIAENQLYRAQLGGSDGASLSAEQRLRLQSSQSERSSRQQTAQLEVGQQQRQLAQVQSKLANAKATLQVSQGILNDLEAVTKAGGIARVQYLRQQQEVVSNEAEVNQLVEEEARLKLAIAQAGQRLENTVAVSSQDILTKMADNDKRIAEIDGQLNKAIVENQKRMAEIDSQLSQAELTLKYQEIRSPVDGVIFDLKAGSPGFVATSTEPVLKVVPDDSLMVEVFISNKDIGFIQEGLPVDIRVDSFPFSEFGDLKGQLVSIGSDALPPTQTRQFYSFPAKIRLDQQSLNIRGRDIALQSGMSVSVNIKLRQRTVMSIFSDGFVRNVDTFKSVR